MRLFELSFRKGFLYLSVLVTSVLLLCFGQAFFIIYTRSRQSFEETSFTIEVTVIPLRKKQTMEICYSTRQTIMKNLKL